MPKARSLDDLLDDWSKKEKRVAELCAKIDKLEDKKQTILNSKEYESLAGHLRMVHMASNTIGLRLFFTLAKENLSIRQVKQKVKEEFSIPTLAESYLQPYIHFGFVRQRDGKYKITDLGRAYLNYLQKD